MTAVATPEQPPQAQIFGTPGALVLPSGTTAIRISIAPVEPAALPADGHIAGNVYHISVTNQAGAAIRALASAQLTVVLRGPSGSSDATIERWTGSAWEKLHTSSAGLADTYLAVATDFGDFALVVPGPAPSGAPNAQASSGASSSAAVGLVESPAPAESPATQPAPATAGGGLSPLLIGSFVLTVVGLVLLAAALWQRRREQSAVERQRLDDWSRRRRNRPGSR